MRELFLDAAGWKCGDDLYDDFFRVVGAPSWHGRNFNALNDSISVGSINAVEVPYRLVIRNYDLIGPDAAKIACDFIDLIHAIAARGYPVEVRTENSAQ